MSGEVVVLVGPPWRDACAWTVTVGGRRGQLGVPLRVASGAARVRLRAALRLPGTAVDGTLAVDVRVPDGGRVVLRPLAALEPTPRSGSPADGVDARDLLRRQHEAEHVEVGAEVVG